MPKSELLVGFAVKSGDWLNAIGVLCSPVDANSNTGALSSADLRGGGGGSPSAPVQCPVNNVAVGLILHFMPDNRRVRGIGLDCKNVQDVHRQGLGRIVALGHTDTPGDSLLCNPGNAIVRVDINWGSDVNGVGVACGPIQVTAPAATASTSGLRPGELGTRPGILVRPEFCPPNNSAPSNTVQGNTDSKTAEAAILCLINNERVAHGLTALTVNAMLATVALTEGQAAINIKWWNCPKTNPDCSHVNPKTGTDPPTRINNSGYCGGAATDTGEITWNGSGTGDYFDDGGNQTTFACLHGCGSPAAAVDWWMNISPPHRANILKPAHKEVGIAAMGDIGMSGGGPNKGLYVVDFAACH
jgi:uncharacterized protein YkwD